MKIFYGVQGTGNGHITRARVMAKHLHSVGHDITFQFTGRPQDQYFDMEIFKNARYCNGLTFNTNNGQVNYIKTALESKPLTFYKDVKTLDLSEFDLVLCDYEPITAWSAKMQKKPVIGIGHQYAFNHDIPITKTDPISTAIMKHFAPVNIGIGLHWHHFDQPILPPIIETSDISHEIQKNKIVVYLPFENQNQVVQHLLPFTDFEFHIYAPIPPVEINTDHITYHPLSREGFHSNLNNCAGIISNSGFELISEALHLGKKILTKPLHAQMEQISNAKALTQLGYGESMTNLDTNTIAKWLEKDSSMQVQYPDVAHIIVEWINHGMPEIDQRFIQQVWDNVEITSVTV